jgi:hypothetical protein
MKTMFLNCCAIILLAGCSKSGAPSPDELIGSWNWIAQHIGAPQNTTTPQTTGIREQLQFQSDNTWRLVQQDTVVRSGTYQLTYSKSSSATKVKTLRTIEHITTITRTQYYTIKNDTLIFDNSLMGVTGGGQRIYAK